jgi:Mg-chelatase subunit ChlD
MIAFSFRLLFWLFMSASVLAQPIEISKMVVDFGVVEQWNNPPADFPFVNSSVSPQYLLAPKYSSKVLVQMPRSRIESGESGLIRVFVYPGKTGAFEERVQFYASGSTEPIVLTVRGRVKSLAPNAALECPKFGESAPAPQSERTVVGVVLSRASGKAIPNAKVDFPSQTGLFTNFRGKFSLKLPFGLYSVAVEAEGYEPYYGLSRIAFSTDSLVYWLNPLGEEPKDSLVPTPIDLPPPITYDDPSDFDRASFKANNIVLLIDVSGSMRQDNRMGQVKEAVRGLISLFRDIDAISLMTFNTQSRLWLELVPGNQKNRLYPRVDSLRPAGQTNGLAALHQAFDLAGKGYISGGENRVVLITDGQFALSQELKTRLVQEKRKGVELLVIGFGGEQDKGVLGLQKLAEAVQGRFLRFAPGLGQEKSLVEFIRQASRK